MKATLTYIFKRKLYKDVVAKYAAATTQYSLAYDLWTNHHSYQPNDSFEWKSFVASNFSNIETIDSWIQNYNSIKQRKRDGILWLFQEKGFFQIPELGYNEYKLINDCLPQITRYQGYVDKYNSLIARSKEAVDRFLSKSTGKYTNNEIERIATHEHEIIQIANILELAKSCRNKYPRSWKVFAKRKELSDISIPELKSITEEAFNIKESFLVLYEHDEELVKLIAGPQLYPLDSFSQEALDQADELAIILANRDIAPIEHVDFKVSLDNETELKRAILDSTYYGERCNFADSFTISDFYKYRRDFDDIDIHFDDALIKLKENESAVKAYNQERGNKATTYIEDYLRIVTRGSSLYDYIEKYKKEKEQREQAQRIKRNYERGYNALFNSIDPETSSLSDVLAIISAESRIINKDRELEEIERQRREAEHKRQEQLRKAQEVAELKSCVQSWYQPSRSCVNCFSLYYYYPTNWPWDASEDEWDVRNLIWDFKANPNRPQSEQEIKNRHERAVHKVIPRLTRVIQHYFGHKKTELTLVCIPSSKKIVTERRYKDLAEELCGSTGMRNGYGYVNVVSDGQARHLGGTEQAQFSVDASFFKGRYVLLFDDVITSGASMEQFKRLLEASGATVIGGLSIGKTKHERQGLNPIDRI